jgi:hypothetical protein
MSTKLGKKSGKPIFKQIIDLIPQNLFRTCVQKHKSDKYCSKYFSYDQLISGMFGQLNRCLSLREIAIGIDQSPEFLADVGLKQSPAKSSMSAVMKSVTIAYSRIYIIHWLNIIVQICKTDRSEK